ncbi:S49 family peptidase [Variovorax atrisoli]|uniref:S49 family peptidase n=1 Tax=Variovorax atrisoli TaxID=3394203 RepID=UPI0003615F5D|nr:S49 family peptidase [Variovorax paradoxus]
MTLLELLRSPWAILPDRLHEMQAIYATHLRGEKIDIAAVEARLGRPLANDQQEYSVQQGGVAVLSLEGVMAPKANLFMRISGGISTQLAEKQIESAMADSRVRSLLIAWDSPGGSVFGTAELAQYIREASDTKPIVVVSPGMLASAAYFAGSAANAVYVTGPNVHVGSIGVVAEHDYTPRRDGGQTSEIVAGRYKRIASDNAPLTEEGRQNIQERVDYLYSVFVDAVAQQRSTTTDLVLERMADGRVFVGQQAIDAGLVDGVATIDALVEQLATDPAKFATRRKAVFAVAGLPSVAAGAAPEDESSNREKEPVMPDADNKTPLTRESFERDHAALFASLRSEFSAQGATQERERIQAVRATAMPGHEKLVEQLAFDGKTTAGEAAQQVLAAERSRVAAAAQGHFNDAPPAAPGAHAPDGGEGEKDTDRSVGKRAAAAFNKLRGLS